MAIIADRPFDLKKTKMYKPPRKNNKSVSFIKRLSRYDPGVLGNAVFAPRRDS
jgi:hypothetical protein